MDCFKMSPQILANLHPTYIDNRLSSFHSQHLLSLSCVLSIRVPMLRQNVQMRSMLQNCSKST